MTSAADRQFKVEVRVKGQENSDLYKCIQSVRVEENIRQGSTFELVVTLCRNDDGSWPYVDTDQFQLWNRLRIAATVGKVTDVILDGYISDIHIATTPQTATMQANFAGVDASYVMNLQPHCKTWPGTQAYEDIATQILNSYQFPNLKIAPSKTSSASTPPPGVVQRDTDLRFLRDLARRRGYEFYVLGGTAFFGPPDLTSMPQKLIAVNFGDETNCGNLQISVDGTRATDVLVARQDPQTGATIAETDDGSSLPAMGSDNPSDQRGYGVGPTRKLPRSVGPLAASEVKDFVQARMADEKFWLRATGTLNALRYGAILRAGKPVTIKGLGKIYNGVYYVRRVSHLFTYRTYHMEFEAWRTQTGQTGQENNTGEDPSNTASPPALGPGAGDVIDTQPDGNRVA